MSEFLLKVFAQSVELLLVVIVLLFVVDVGEFEAEYDHSNVGDNPGSKVRRLCDPHETKAQHDESIKRVVLSFLK